MSAAHALEASRSAAGLSVPLVLPLIILFASAPGTSRQIVAELTVLDIFVLSLVFTMIAIVNMPSLLAHYRRRSRLRSVLPVGLNPRPPVGLNEARNWAFTSILTSNTEENTRVRPLD